MRIVVYLVILVSCAFSQALAQSHLSDLQQRIWVCYNASYLEDADGSFSLNEVLSGSKDSLLQPINERILNGGYSKSVFWVRFEVKNDLSQMGEPSLWVLGPNINNLDLYQTKGEPMLKFSTRGLDHPHNIADMVGGSYIYDIQVAPGETNVYYLRANNNIASLRLPIMLWERNAYRVAQSRKSILMGVSIGIISLVMLATLLAFVYVRDTVYGWYFMYLSALLLTLTHGQALLFENFWPNRPQLNDTVTVLVPIFSVIMLVRFSQAFLNTKERLKLIHYIGTVGIVVFVAIALSWFFKDHLGMFSPAIMFMYSFTPFVMLLSFLIAGLIGIARGDTDSKMYVLAFSPLLVLSVGILLRNNGLFQHYDIFEFNIPIGLTSEAIVFSAALAYRMQRVRTEKERLLIELNDLQTQRFRNVIEAVENERKRIAIDLHDSLGQLLSTAKLNVSVWGDQVAEEDEENYETSMKLLDRACNEVREISYTMMPSTLIRLGFISALKESAANINMAGRIKVSLDVSEYSGRLDETKGISLYRICQEILNNAIKYSEADELTIKITESNDRLFLFIKDDGIGFDTQKLDNSSGIGWSNIFSRISMLNGHIRVFSNQSSGTSVHIDVPL